jgi:hypothetical protein
VRRLLLPALLILAIPLVAIAAEGGLAADRGFVATAVAEAEAADAARLAPRAFMRGMTVSCQTWGPEWGSPAMQQSLAELRGLGVDWVAIHPYASVDRDGSLRFTPVEELDFLERAVSFAAAEKQRLFWKPHLAYWGRFAWRGEIAFADEAQWRRFFADYERWITDHARFAEKHRLPLLAVGTELEKTVHREREWRHIIAKVREVYSGRITWAANWDGVERVPFWDAVDLIGVQAYFPIADDARPTRAQMEGRWRSLRAKLRDLSRRKNRRVVLTEIGYPRARGAAKEPWKPSNDKSDDVIALRRELMDVALAQIGDEPIIDGAFWWKWMPGAAPWDADFSMKDPEAREALSAAWARP